VIHVHLSEKGSFIREGALVLLARLRGLTIVVTNHGSKFVKFAARRPEMVSRVLRACDLCLCFSEDAILVCRRLAPNVPSAVIVNPTTADPASPTADLTGEIALFAGSVGVRKGVDILLTAWEEVTKSRPDAKLLIAGPPTEFLLPVVASVQSMGPLENEDIRAVMREARVVVLPSRDEALPVVLAEALAGGRPFVATPVGGIPWLAHGVQVLVPVGDSHALALALIDLLGDPQLAAERGEMGREFHTRNLSMEAADSAMRSHYEAAVARRH
jgi:glycosyltransferase involved in cell wall biosynthesis